MPIPLDPRWILLMGNGGIFKLECNREPDAEDMPRRKRLCGKLPKLVD
jgi:hypothetical protein